MRNPILPLLFIQIFLQFFADKTIGVSSSYQWDSADPSKNVKTFAKFIDDIYTNYDHTATGYSVEQKQIYFNLTFVKYATEIATFRVLDNKIGEGEEVPNLNVIREDGPVKEFLDFLHYDQKLGHHIAKAYNETVFCAAKNQIHKRVVDQILQLTFSLAIRITLCVIYENYFSNCYDFGGWQLEQLLSAYGGTNENGIFPFQIIRIDAQTKEHFWDEIKANSAREPQFIENFNFLLKLGESTLSYYEVYKVLEAILMRWSNTEKSSADNNGEQPPELYTFMEQYFNSKLNSQILQKKDDDKQIGSSSKRRKPKKDANESDVRTLSKTDCAFVHFGTALLHRIDFRLIGTISAALSDFKHLISERKKECGTKAHWEFNQLTMYFRDNITRDNTPSVRCVRLEMDLFREPLWNYARMVGIDSNKCIAVFQFGEALRKRIQAKLNSVEMEKQQQQNPIENPSKSNEFKILKDILGEISDEENYGKMHKYEKTFNMDLLVGNEIVALKELLDQIIGHYADGTEESCQLGNRRSIVLDSYSRQKIKFSKILFETLSKHSQNVNYDEKRQLLSFPLSTGEHIITRLSELIRQQRHTIQEYNNSRQIDVMKTIQNIASNEPIHFYKRKWTSFSYEWIKFDLFLSMAIRLSAQIERNDCLNALLFGGPKSYESYYVFDYKIQITNGNLVEMNTPTWHVPYFVYWGNNKDRMVKLSDHERSEEAVEEALVQREAGVNFKFLLSLSEYSPTFDELIKMANFFANIDDDGHILGIPSDFKTLEIVMKFLKKPYYFNSNPKVPDQHLPCIMAYFVEEFLKKAMAENHYLVFFGIESNGMVIENFAEKKERMCGDKSMKNEMSKFFGETIVNFANAIKINFAAPYENFDLFHSLSEYSPTVYEVIKMAKILGNIKNDGQILVLRSDSQIFHFILKYLANSTAEESANQTKFAIKYSFCFLAQFVEELLKKAMKVNELEELLNIELIGEAIESFADKKEQKCANKNTQNGINKYLNESMMDFAHLAHAIKIDFTHNDLQKIVPDLLFEMGKMKEEKNWNYADLNQKEMLEWKLIEIELINEEKMGKWEAIESARKEWKENFDRTVFNENGRENGKIEEKMEQLMEELKHLQIEKENGQNKKKNKEEKEEEKEGKEGKKEKGKVEN